MTIGLVIKCEDAIVVASDSLATWSNASRYTNKIRVIQNDYLQHPVVVAGAGTIAFIDKFIDRCQRKSIEWHCKKIRGDLKDDNYKLDIIDFAEEVGEQVLSGLYDEYVNFRSDKLGINLFRQNYSLSFLVAGATKEGELRAYTIYEFGLSANIESYDTIGSGASYAEIFLRDLTRDGQSLSIEEASNLALHAVKVAEIMDPYVGGMAKIKILELEYTNEDQPSLRVRDFSHNEKQDREALVEMNSLLRDIGSTMRQVAKKEQPFSNAIQSQVEMNQPVDDGTHSQVQMSQHN